MFSEKSKILSRILCLFLCITISPTFILAQQEDDDWDSYEDEYEDTDEIADPLKFWNVPMFHLNDKAYFWVLKPVGKGLRKVLPEPMRIGVRRFFKNFYYPVRASNCVLQWKWKEAGTETERFVINTTVGVLGFWDPAKEKYDINPHKEDLGQTLAVWGVGDGCYFIIPFLGPSSLRDTVGVVGDMFVTPSFYMGDETAMYLTATRVLNETSLSIGDYESMKEASLDPYESIRDIYFQYRAQKIKE